LDVSAACLLGGLADQIGSWQIFVCVSHVDKIKIVMIINSASFKFDCHLYYHGGFSLCILLCMEVIRRMKKKRRKI
jgi:hypothetical protein